MVTFLALELQYGLLSRLGKTFLDILGERSIPGGLPLHPALSFCLASSLSCFVGRYCMYSVLLAPGTVFIQFTLNFHCVSPVHGLCESA